MKIGGRFLFGIAIGVLLGAILGVLLVNLFQEQLCPSTLCINKASVVPIADRGYFPAVHRELERAQQSIHIVAFEMKYYEDYQDSNQNRIVEALVDAHERGVDVRIIVDEYSKENNAYEFLREKGILIRYDSEAVTTHSKLIIIDGKIVILGSTNFSYYGLEKNHEANILVDAKNVAEYFEGYFEELWSIRQP